jgi:Copper transport outer membrane protein, MctB
MISFRFHLVSLIAVFLALGLGILVGSTVVDQVIVDRLDREIRSVRHDSSEANAENRALKDQLAQSEDFLKKSAAYTVDQRLEQVPVVLVAEKGVDAGVMKSMLTTLRAAGAVAPGVFWLDDAWRLDAADELTALHTAASVTGNNATARLAAMRVLAQRLTEPAPRGGRGKADVLDTLSARGFVDFTDGKKADLATFPTQSARVLVVTGTDSRLDGSETLVDLVQALVAVDAPVVVAEAYDNHHLAAPVPVRGASVAPVRGDVTLSKDVSTLDDGELVQGQVTAVIALEQLAAGTVGHYGYGQGAQSPLPALAS